MSEYRHVGDGLGPVEETLAECGAAIAQLRAELAELREEAASHDRVVSAWHGSTVEAGKIYNDAHGITDGRWPDQGEMIRWFMEQGAALQAENARKHVAITKALEEWQECADAGGHWDRVRHTLESALSTPAPAGTFVTLGLLRKLNVLVAESLASSCGSYFNHEKREEIKQWLAAAIRDAEKEDPCSS